LILVFLTRVTGNTHTERDRARDEREREREREEEREEAHDVTSSLVQIKTAAVAANS